MALIHSILMGAVAGMRAMTPLATVTAAACNGRLPAGNGAPRLLANPLVSAGAKALAAGELVAIFPEGKVTSDGELNAFRPGISRILQSNPVPVVPLALSGLWGSLFSRRDPNLGSPLAKARPFRKVAIAAGLPVAAENAEPETLRGMVLSLRGETA